MTTDERIRRIKEVEGLLSAIVEKGWRVSSVSYIEEDCEDFRVELNMSTDGKNPKEGVL